MGLVALWPGFDFTMKFFYNPAYTTDLAVNRLRVSADGLVIEAEGYGAMYPGAVDLLKWCYRWDRENHRVDWFIQPKPSWLRRWWNKLTKS